MKLRILSVVFLIALVLFITPTKALAVLQSLNGQTGQTQTFSNDPNVTISSSGNVHSLGWQGQLPVSRGGTGVGSFTLGSLLFSSGTSISQDNSNLFWDDSNNRLGIGTSSPSGQTHIAGPGQVSTDNYGLRIDDKTAGTNNYNLWSGPPLTALNSQVQADWTEAVGKNAFISLDYVQYGQTGWFLSQTSNTDANGLTGISYVTTGGISSFGSNSYAYSIAPTGQTVPQVVSAYTISSNEGGGTVTGMQGIYIDTNTNSSGGNVINNYGIQIQDQNVGTNNYSIYTNQSSNSNNYALYNAGLAKSYFGGDVGIGTTTPSAKLDVAGTIKGDSTVILGNTNTPACIEMADSDGSGVTYVTANDGVLSASTTKPSFCQ